MMIRIPHLKGFPYLPNGMKLNKISDTQDEAVKENVGSDSGTGTTTTNMPLSDTELHKYAKLSPDPGRKLTLDNVDIHQTTHTLTEDNENPDAHFCSSMSVNRVSGAHLPDDKPTCDLYKLENAAFRPSRSEHMKQ